jgi:hypothetical protein
MKPDGSLRVLKYPKLAVIKKITQTHPHSPPPTPLFGHLLVFTTFNEECELYPYPPMNMKN